jgi:hypothetical protein
MMYRMGSHGSIWTEAEWFDTYIQIVPDANIVRRLWFELPAVDTDEEHRHDLEKKLQYIFDTQHAPRVAITKDVYNAWKESQDGK